MQRLRKNWYEILQGLRLVQAAVTERWPLKAEKRSKNWGGNYFAHRSFSKVGQKQKTEKKKKKKKERKKD